jgi:hypothetical protein
VGVEHAHCIVVCPAPAQGLFVLLRFEKDGTPIASGMVRHVQRKDSEAAHSAMAKLDHGFRMGLWSPDIVTIPARFVNPQEETKVILRR